MAIPVFELRRVEHRYPDGTLALRGVDLAVSEGESVALLGPNGAGKSTLLLHLNGILRASAGTVLVEGVEISDETVRDIRARVGLVFQDPDDQLFMTTLYDDVAFGPLNMGLSRDETDERVFEALRAVDLTQAASRPAQHLSLGQRKRAALATVLSMRPPALVLDEPTSSLDPRGRREITELFAALPSTKIVATHDMDLAARLCERAVVMDDGLVVRDGPSSQVMVDVELLESHGLEAPAATIGL